MNKTRRYTTAADTFDIDMLIDEINQAERPRQLRPLPANDLTPVFQGHVQRYAQAA